MMQRLCVRPLSFWCVCVSALLPFAIPNIPRLGAQVVSPTPPESGMLPAVSARAPKYKPGEVLVRFRSGVGSAKQQTIHSAMRAQITRAYAHVRGQSDNRDSRPVSITAALVFLIQLRGGKGKGEKNSDK